MSVKRIALYLLFVVAMLASGGCAGLQRTEPVGVNVAGIEPLPGQGLEVRMLVKLRIQNPNDVPLDYNGLFVRMDVQGKPFATGVSDAVGSVPRFGETVVSIPLSVSLLSVTLQAMDAMTGEYREKLEYELTGRLAGPAFNSMRFNSKGEFALPAGLSGSVK